MSGAEEKVMVLMELNYHEAWGGRHQVQQAFRQVGRECSTPHEYQRVF